MRFLFILMFIASCSSNPVNEPKNSALKNEYLSQFQYLAEKMKPQTERCLIHSKNTFKNSIVEKLIDDKKYKFQFENNKAKLKALQTYDPNNFDWHEKAEIKNLYLKFPFDESISHAHFEKSNDLNDCANDFDHLNFLTTVVESWEQDKANKKLHQSVLQKYFDYMAKNETPLIAVLTLDHIVQLLHEKEIIVLKDPEAYKKASNDMSNKYTHVGKAVLLGLQDKNYEDIYNLDKELLDSQRKFKKLIFDQISFPK